jgi:hypothetical protein
MKAARKPICKQLPRIDPDRHRPLPMRAEQQRR